MSGMQTLATPLAFMLIIIDRYQCSELVVLD